MSIPQGKGRKSKAIYSINFILPEWEIYGAMRAAFTVSLALVFCRGNHSGPVSTQRHFGSTLQHLTLCIRLRCTQTPLAIAGNRLACRQSDALHLRATGPLYFHGLGSCLKPPHLLSFHLQLSTLLLLPTNTELPCADGAAPERDGVGSPSRDAMGDTHYSAHSWWLRWLYDLCCR
jgi:hypothetical protein